MLQLYPRRAGPRTARVLADSGAVAWTLLWIAAAVLVFQTVIALQSIADGLTGTGQSFNRLIDVLRHAGSGVPLIGGFINTQAAALEQVSGDRLVTIGQQAHSAIATLAWVLALMVAAPPIVIVTGTYALWRARDVREMGAAAGFVRAAVAAGRADEARALLAHRALATLSFRRLMSASRNPVGDLASGDHQALAAAMLDHAGVDPGLLADQPRPRLR